MDPGALRRGRGFFEPPDSGEVNPADAVRMGGRGGMKLPPHGVGGSKAQLNLAELPPHNEDVVLGRARTHASIEVRIRVGIRVRVRVRVRIRIRRNGSDIC